MRSLSDLDGLVHVGRGELGDEWWLRGGELGSTVRTFDDPSHLAAYAGLLDTLRACLATYGFPETVLQSEQDSLKVFESGPEQAPVVNLFNVRPKDAPHGGVCARSMSRRVAEQLADQLTAIG